MLYLMALVMKPKPKPTYKMLWTNEEHSHTYASPHTGTRASRHSNGERLDRAGGPEQLIPNSFAKYGQPLAFGWA